MRSPRMLTPAEQEMVAEALRYRASAVRTEIALARTQELMTRTANDHERRRMNQLERDLATLARLLEDQSVRVEVSPSDRHFE